MANYVHNRILCSKETASHLITSDNEYEKNKEKFGKDSYYSHIDFRKALDIPIWDYTSKYVPQEYGWDIPIKETSDGRIDIRFNTRWFSPYDVIVELITKYHDIDWYAFEEEIIEEEHYYWFNDSVVNDMNSVPEEKISKEYWHDEEEDYENDDDNWIFNIFDIFQSPKFNQNEFVNYKPKKDTEEYKKYYELVKYYGEIVINDIKTGKNTFFVNDFNDNGYDNRIIELDRPIRSWYLHDSNVDRKKYNLSIMSSDISNYVIEKLKLHNEVKKDIREGEEVVIKKTGVHAIVENTYKGITDKYWLLEIERAKKDGVPCDSFKRNEFIKITSPYPPIETKMELIENVSKINVEDWICKKTKKFKNKEEAEDYVRKLILDTNTWIYKNTYEWIIRSKKDFIVINKYSYNVTNI